jgi:hypothetical protein
VVVRRPDPPAPEPVARFRASLPPDDLSLLWEPAPPVPWGLADRAFARLRPLREAVRYHPLFVGMILLGLFAFAVAACVGSVCRNL